VNEEDPERDRAMMMMMMMMMISVLIAKQKAQPWECHVHKTKKHTRTMIGADRHQR